MTSWIRRFLCAACVFSLLPATFASPASKNKDVTRDLLLQGSPVPDRREYPLSQKVGACQDFHKYVCDEVESHFHLPADRSRWLFAFSDAAERILHAKKNYFKLLQKGYSPRSERAAQLKNYYLACMNAGDRKREERELVKTEKKNVLALKTNEELKEFFEKRLLKPYFTMANFNLIPNQADPGRQDLVVTTEIMSLPEKTAYENKENLEDLRNLAEAFFKTIQTDHPAKRAAHVVEFETAFAKTFPTPAEFRQLFSADTYRPQADFVKKYPNLKLQGLFSEVPSDIRVRDVTGASLEFVSEALDREPLDKLKSIALFHSLHDYLDDAYPAYFKKEFEFSRKHFGGPSERPPRDERCTRAVMGHFPMELDQELIPILFPSFPEEKVTSLAEKVRASILNGLKKNKWLSEDARKEALNKIDKAKLNLVKPKKDEDWNFLPVQQYDAHQPLTNLKRVSQAKIDKILKEAREKRNQDRWSIGPLSVNAYYSSFDNKFVLLQGILQYPFFDGQLAEFENIGAIGAVSGHEMGHSVDDMGSKYDADGKLRQWMSMKDLGEFSKRGDRFIERFDKVGHNGRLTLGENIGDHVGLTFAFDAAFPDAGQATPEDVRRFFISYGRLWCGVQTPEAEKMQLKTDPHALGWARINEQVIHHDAFATAFSCKTGDPMYVEPKDRIRVW